MTTKILNILKFLNSLNNYSFSILFIANDNRLKYLSSFGNTKFTSILESEEFIENTHLPGEAVAAKIDVDNYFTEEFIFESDKYLLFACSDSNMELKKLSSNQILNLKDLIKNISQIPNVKTNNSLAKQDFFHLFAETSNDFVFILDERGYFRKVNEIGTKTLKYEKQKLLGKHIFDLISENYKSEIIQAFQEILSNEGVTNFRVEFLPKVGFEILFDINALPLKENGKVVEVFCVATNITKLDNEKKKLTELNVRLTEANRIISIERDRAKEQIAVLSELNKLKNEFISNVSHELRTPLASIVGFSETIADDGSLTAKEIKEFNDIILTESKRLAKLINDVLDFSELESKKQKLNLKKLDLINLIKKIIPKFENSARAKRITFTNELPESEIIILGDENRLMKAISYLLANALKFTDNNGRVKIIVQEFLKEVEIAISDTGVGISKEIIPDIFQKFNKVSSDGKKIIGAGFGLVTVKQIIDLHRGLIRVKSELSRGTTFIVRLPKHSLI